MIATCKWVAYGAAGLVMLASGSCNTNNKGTDVKQLAGGFANSECRAMQLREKRFALANEIRFTQDTLMSSSNKGDTLRLHSKLQQLNQQKEYLLQESRALGDSLKTALDNLQQTQLTDTASKRRFNEELTAILKERGCL